MQTSYRTDLTSKIVCSSLQKNIHCPDVLGEVLLKRRGNARKKLPSLHFTTTKGTSKTFLYNYKILFHYNFTSLNINLPGFDSLFLE